ncbi:uncharacterized protein LOC131634023 isoform X2 [Vicia villosa]|uniref:uncharacterized protein LOC131634023 isoform X2 n=1 Tax=Vicia villosa TaxID=3911 RepID=UPI00273BFF15|nr:uncharacterized protein LOC131634023 isoform X2 [Vicia villosa]
MASNENQPQDDTIDDGYHENIADQEAEIRRGITLMKRVIRDRDRGILLDAHWSESGLLIEPNGSKITSFIGTLVRNAIPITCDDWRDTNLGKAKDKLWIEIQRSFNNLEDNRRKICLKLAGRLLRGFRTFLTRRYLMDANKNFVDADYPERYSSLISREEWVTFKAKRKNPNFRSRSETNRQRASGPPYPYRKGRMGYGRLEQSILTRESSPETSVPPHVLWKEARVGKDGVVKEDVEKVFEKCETLSQSISPDESNDCRSILSRALDIPEYSGRVRGKGFGITPTSLKMKKQKAPRNRELQETLYALQAEVRELKREKELREQASGCKATSDKGSIGCNFQPNLSEGISPCQLYLSSPTYWMVGKGKVHNTLGELLHTRPLPTGCLKVSVDIALEKDALLPHPDDVSDATLVGDAIGSFVAWPSSLISVDDETPTKSKAKDKELPQKIESVASIKEMHAKEIEDVSKGKKPKMVVPKKTAAKKKPTPNKFRSCLFTFLQLSDIPQGNTYLVPMEEDLFGIEYQERIGMEDFEQIFEHTQLGLGIIDTYISGHWFLVAINPIREVVYFLYSLHNDLISTYEAMKELVDTVIQVFRAQRGSQVPKSKANNITWIRVECPEQCNEVDCGFYMLRFMKEILLLNQIEIPSKYFDDFKCATYSRSKLDELKEDWCQFRIELKVE